MLKFIYGIDSKKAAQSWELKMQLTIETLLANFTVLSSLLPHFPYIFLFACLKS